MKPATSAGGWKAVRYTLRMANQAGWLPLWRAMRSRNACKTCALGMGGQRGGMVNEAGHFPEVCKKSLQAMVADMQAGISPEFFARYSIAELRTLSPRELDVLRLVAQGLPDAQIAERLVVSRNTVNSHMRAIYSKLGVNTRTAAARLATDHDLA